MPTPTEELLAELEKHDERDVAAIIQALCKYYNLRFGKPTYTTDFTENLTKLYGEHPNEPHDHKDDNQ